MINKEELKRHRDKIFNDILEMLKTNQRVGCVQPTGIGKSYCIARLCNKLKGKKLVLEPGTEVINYMQLFDIETPDTDYITYHSLLRPSATDLANMFKEYDYIFLDEMHRALAPKWGKQLDKTFAILDVLEASYKILGFSATPTRMDNRDAVEEIFQGVQIEPYYLQDAILDGILPNIEYHSSIYEITDKDKNKLKLKDIPLAKQILSYDIDEGVSNIFQENLDLTQPHHIIVFVDKIANIPEAIKNMKKWLKIDFSIYQAHSKMSYKESKEAIENFQRDENLSLMFAVDILNEGIHLDKVDTSVFLRKTSSTRVYNQQLGRVVSDTIENPKVFDLVNNIDNLETGYAAIFKEKASQLKIKTEQLITKNGEHLKITTHQEDLIEKLKKYLKNRTFWTKEEDEFLEDNYENMTDEELSVKLNKTVGAIKSRRSLKRLGRVDIGIDWTEEEIQFLKANYKNMTDKELSIKLNRTESAVKAKRSLERLIRVKRFSWTEEEIQFLKDNYKTMSNEELAKVLNKSLSNIRDRKSKLSLHKYIIGVSWTKEDDEFLKSNYKNMTDKELAKRLNRTLGATKHRKSELGLTKKVDNPFWTEEEIQLLKANYKNMTDKELTKIIDRPICSISTKRHNLNLYKPKVRDVWPEEDDEFLKANYKNMTDKELATVLGRTVGSIKGRRQRVLGLVKENNSIFSSVKQKVVGTTVYGAWTEEETQFLKDNYKNMTAIKLAKKLNRNVGAVTGKISRLSLKK